MTLENHKKYKFIQLKDTTYDKVLKIRTELKNEKHIFFSFNAVIDFLVEYYMKDREFHKTDLKVLFDRFLSKFKINDLV